MELRRMAVGDEEAEWVSIGTIPDAALPTGYVWVHTSDDAVMHVSPREMRELAQMLKDCATRVEDEHDTEGWS